MWANDADADRLPLLHTNLAPLAGRVDVVATARTENPALMALGRFKSEAVPIAKIGANTAGVQQMLDRVGFK